MIVAEPRGAHQTHPVLPRQGPEREIWDGFRYGPEAAREAFGFDEAYPISKLDEMLPEAAGGPACRILCIRDRYGMGYARDRLDQPGAAAGAQRGYPARRKFVISGFCWTRCACSKARKSFKSCVGRLRFPRMRIGGQCRKPGPA